ncbi:MAG TPA: alcohol dehydrogenase [Chloroflexi bacterium]|nr:alcohol dehydrogenase [Chloroflexota bacterium]
MQAIAVVPGTTTVRMVDRPEPQVQAPDEVKVRVIRVGICGTDREEAAGGRALAPAGREDLVIGHEMFGQVVAVGPAVTRVKVGDYALFTVRRGCGKCLPCAINRADMCRTGDYRERGIWGLDGFQAEYVVDRERHVVQVPSELEPVGVLTEPLSIAEKAIGEAVGIQFARLPDAQATPLWLAGRRCLVAGLGPVGLLAALALRVREAEVYGLDIVDADSSRPRWLEQIGGQYVDGRQVPADRVDETLGPMDLIVEAAGVARLAFNLLDALAFDAVYVLTGIPAGDRLIDIHGPALARHLVLGNQAMVGSVNAARDHFQMAVQDLAIADKRWPGHVARLMTGHYPATEFPKALAPQEADEIKVVVDWAPSSSSTGRTH